MRRRALAGAALLILLALSPAAGWAQSAELNEARREGEALHEAGKYAEAIPHFEKALRLAEREFGLDHPQTATSLNELAGFYLYQGRHGEAEPLYERALASREKALSPDHPDVAQSLNGLALLYKNQGRFSEAELLYKRALVILETTVGHEHGGVGAVLHNLAEIYRLEGRSADAESLYKRALGVAEKAFGPNDTRFATILYHLALVYESQSRYDEAESLSKRAVSIKEMALGPDHPELGSTLLGLGYLYLAPGRYEKAEAPLKRALEILDKSLGPEHVEVANSLHNLAYLYRVQGRHADAEPLYKRSLAILEKALPPEHPDVAEALNNLVLLYDAQGRRPEALGSIRRASAIHGARAARAGGAVSPGALAEQRNVRHVFLWHVHIALDDSERDPGARGSLTAEAFEAGQLANASGTAAAVARMGARFAAGGDALARLARERQDLGEAWRRLDKRLIEASIRPPEKRDSAAEARLRAELSETDRRLKDLDARLLREFPTYAELASPKPVALAEVQGLLAADEALLAFAVSTDLTFLWVVRKDRAEAHTLDIGAKALEEAVTALRAGLDPAGVAEVKDIPPFDTTRAFELYAKLFTPAEPLLEGASHVFVVPDGALQSLPLGVLVTKEPQAPVADFAGYREAPWLARRYALTTLPSVSSLRALRRFAKEARARAPFIGIGDPALDGLPGQARRVALASLFTPRGLGDVRAVRELPALPDTADELKALAKALGAGEESVLLRQAATERRVKAADLASARVLAFATHGLVAGDLKGLAEPALVLTPPAEATPEDDGLLTASEVAQLKLNADWVILSACNTAAADGTPGADALSGLAKAFFYAGSRTLLVSHWPVFSDAAVRLTTGAFAEAAKDPRMGRAEALRRSMLALMNDAAKPHYAHPLFWAPFVVVGEGGRAEATPK